MTRERTTRRIVIAVALLVVFAAGIAGAAYVLVHERLPVPFRHTYDLNAQLTAADGIVPGLGQPVNVAGVQVGSIVGARVQDGLALVTLQLDRNQLRRVYANANVTLEPVTPLGDVEIDLSPGRPPARALAAGATIGAGQTASPVPLETLLSNLDTDTRSWLGSLIASLGQGTGGEGANLRRALVTLGPSAAQVRQITGALATRRHDLAGLVHNLAVLTRAASQDGQLSQLVTSGDATLRALASQDVPLRQSIALAPGALARLDTTLGHLRTFASELDPTLDALLPAVRRLPATLTGLEPFAQSATAELKRSINPFVAQAAPVVETLGPAVRGLNQATPYVTGSLQVANYLLNELAYNPGGKNQGFLYWLDWFFHNWNSVFSEADANGVLPRANILMQCNALAAAGKLGKFLTTALAGAKLC
jgi:phospholipid/cholesterol/gamma-HCH transport system substrate-binding protein